jgi:hypothetical protein
VGSFRVIEMRQLRSEGRTLREIGAVFGVSRQRVMQILGPTGTVRRSRARTKPTRLCRHCGAALTPDHRVDLLAHFDQYVDRSAGPDACWPWTRFRQRQGNGYGHIVIGGRTFYAHRVALERAIGRGLRKGEWACHTCDNQPCCNPAHLYVGDPTSNARDREQRFYRRQGKATSAA